MSELGDLASAALRFLATWEVLHSTADWTQETDKYAHANAEAAFLSAARAYRAHVDKLRDKVLREGWDKYRQEADKCQTIFS